MDSLDEYEKLRQKKTVFHLMSDDVLEYHDYVMNHFPIARPSLAKGCLYETRCDNCEEKIIIYSLEEVKREYPLMDRNKLIKEYGEDKNNMIGTVEEYEGMDNLKCHKCGRYVILEEDFNPQKELDLNCKTYFFRCECGAEYAYIALRPQLNGYTEHEAIGRIESLIDENSILCGIGEYDKMLELICPHCGKKFSKKKSQNVMKMDRKDEDYKDFCSTTLSSGDFVSAKEERDKHV